MVLLVAHSSSMITRGLRERSLSQIPISIPCLHGDMRCDDQTTPLNLCQPNDPVLLTSAHTIRNASNGHPMPLAQSSPDATGFARRYLLVVRHQNGLLGGVRIAPHHTGAIPQRAMLLGVYLRVKETGSPVRSMLIKAVG